MYTASFTVRVLGANPHKVGTITWRVGQVVTAMAGCAVSSIVSALAALERDTTPKGVADPARWLSHFAGLESDESGKGLVPWIEILHNAEPVKSVASYRELLRA
jgi:hypothetical protein